MTILRTLPFIAAALLSTACTITTNNEPDRSSERRRPPPPPPPPADKPAADPDAGWIKLGEKIVNGKEDRDEVLVGTVEGSFRKLRLRVKDSSLDMDDVVVHFTDGKSFSPKTRHTFKEGATSNPIDLPGEKRRIERIELKYSNRAGGGSATVEVWGHR